MPGTAYVCIRKVLGTAYHFMRATCRLFLKKGKRGERRKNSGDEKREAPSPQPFTKKKKKKKKRRESDSKPPISSMGEGSVMSFVRTWRCVAYEVCTCKRRRDRARLSIVISLPSSVLERALRGAGRRTGSLPGWMTTLVFSRPPR